MVIQELPQQKDLSIPLRSLVGEIVENVRSAEIMRDEAGQSELGRDLATLATEIKKVKAFASNIQRSNASPN